MIRRCISLGEINLRFEPSPQPEAPEVPPQPGAEDEPSQSLAALYKGIIGPAYLNLLRLMVQEGEITSRRASEALHIGAKLASERLSYLRRAGLAYAGRRTSDLRIIITRPTPLGVRVLGELTARAERDGSRNTPRRRSAGTYDSTGAERARSKILEALRDYPDGVSARRLARDLGMSAQAAAGNLYILYRRGKIRVVSETSSGKRYALLPSAEGAQRWPRTGSSAPSRTPRRG